MELLSSQKIKEAKTQYPVNEHIRKRWSARAFNSKAISQENIDTLFEAASWAASSMNEQPWIYIYATREDEASFQKMLDCLSAGNQPWAKNAPLLVLSLAKTTFERNGNSNKHAWYDTGAANTNLILQATEMDIYAHQMGGFDKAKTIEAFNLPADIEPVVFIALGYLDEAEKLPEPFKTRELTERKRKAIKDFVFRKKII
ncbi:MAG TPA: nitroreductase family protein [Cyclobacteriaceae bacterium]|nr:nitroreductase family protein [Cyclobacteriaceae bacterium]